MSITDNFVPWSKRATFQVEVTKTTPRFLDQKGHRRVGKKLVLQVPSNLSEPELRRAIEHLVEIWRSHRSNLHDLERIPLSDIL